jgi:hypothetical protein
MFEIINNIVKELNYMKSGYLVNSSQYHSPPIHEHTDDTIIIQQQPFQSKQIFENKILVSDDDSDNDDSDEDDSDNDDSDNDNSDEEAESDDDNEIVIVNDIESHDNKIKVINIELGDNIEVNDIHLEDDIENDNDSDEQPLQEDFENDTSIIVTKLDGEHLESTENRDVVMNNTTGFKATKDYYVRMNLNELKTLAVTKGLVSDASKMKKVQLIQILIENP